MVFLLQVLAKDSKDVFYGDVLPPGSEKPLREIFVEKQYAVVNTSLPSGQDLNDVIKRGLFCQCYKINIA